MMKKLLCFFCRFLMIRLRLPGRYRLKNLILRNNWYRGIVATVHLGNNVRMELHLDDYVQRNIFFDNYYEKNETAYWKSAVAGKKLVLDIGGNVGYYTLIASPLLHPGGRICMFEPLLLNLERAEKNFRLSNSVNVQAIKCAVSDKPGKVNICVANENNRGASGMRTHIGEHEEVEEVEAITLDAFLQNEGAGIVSIIKMDVEGAEPLVLRGATRLLKEQSPELMIEVCDETLLNMNFGLIDVYDALRQFGYNPYQINDDLSVTPITEQVSKIGLVLFRKQHPVES